MKSYQLPIEPGFTWSERITSSRFSIRMLRRRGDPVVTFDLAFTPEP